MPYQYYEGKWVFFSQTVADHKKAKKPARPAPVAATSADAPATAEPLKPDPASETAPASPAKKKVP